MGGVLAAVTETLLPGMCPYCDQPLQGEDRGLCGACWAMVLPIAGASCPRCGGPVDEDPEPCLQCTRTPPPQEKTVVWGEHDGALRGAILSLKHSGRDDLAGPLGRRLSAAIAAAVLPPSCDLVTWVPSHAVRRLRRPYSAAQLLSLEVARSFRLPHEQLLTRRGLGRQTTRTRAHRLELPARAFRAGPRSRRRSVLLIDDVMTTGSTLRRAAGAILNAGAETVFCAALARTPDPRSFS